MDFKGYLFGVLAGFFSLFGSILTAGAVYLGNIISQEHEDLRHLHALAYESAMTEWKTRAESPKSSEIPVFDDILLEHLQRAYVVRKYGADRDSEQYAGTILDDMLETYQKRHSGPTNSSDVNEDHKKRK